MVRKSTALTAPDPIGLVRYPRGVKDGAEAWGRWTGRFENQRNSTIFAEIEFQGERGMYELGAVFGLEFDKARIGSN